MTTAKKGDDAHAFLKENFGELTFSDAVRSSREVDGLTQVQLAARLGVSKQYVSAVENGRKMVEPKQAKAFADALGESVRLFVSLALNDKLRADGLDLTVSLELVAG